MRFELALQGKNGLIASDFVPFYVDPKDNLSSPIKIIPNKDCKLSGNLILKDRKGNSLLFTSKLLGKNLIINEKRKYIEIFGDTSNEKINWSEQLEILSLTK